MRKLSSWERKQMIEQNMGLVPYAVQRMKKKYPYSMGFEDLCQCGYIGLIKAVDHYRKECGSIGTFAYPWIVGAIYDGMIEYEWVLGRNQIRKAGRYKKALLALEQEGILARDKDCLQAVKEKLNVTEKEAASMRQLAEVSVLYSLPEEQMDWLLCEKATVEEQDRRELSEDTDMLRWAIRGLEETERYIILQHYFEGRTFRQIALECQRSKSWVSDTHQRAIKKLKILLKNQ